MGTPSTRGWGALGVVCASLLSCSSPAPPTTCVSSRECSALGFVCDTVTSTCVECLAIADCLSVDQICVAHHCTGVTTCASSRECTGLVCDRTLGHCVECVSDVDCPAGRCVDSACRVAPDAGATDGGTADVGADASDVGAADDSSMIGGDAASDDVGIDGGSDAGMDAGNDAGADAGVDAAVVMNDGGNDAFVPPDDAFVPSDTWSPPPVDAALGPDSGDPCSPAPEAPGTTCGTALGLGPVGDTGESVVVSGSVPMGSTVWYWFLAVDSPDTSCDRLAVQIAFDSNPGSAYQFQVRRSTCGSGMECGALATTYSWATNASTTSGGDIIGQCPCSPTGGTSTLNQCGDESSVFYVGVRRTGAGTTCAPFSIRITNG